MGEREEVHLTEEQRKSIKKKLSNGATVYALAKEYEVSRQTIMRVRDAK